MDKLGIGVVLGVVSGVLAWAILNPLLIRPSNEENRAIIELIILPPIAFIVGFIVFGVVVWRIGISEANAQAAAIEAGMDDTQSADDRLEAETTTEANPIEMGTCIYCGKEINEETAICDDCLKGQQSNFA